MSNNLDQFLPNRELRRRPMVVSTRVFIGVCAAALLQACATTAPLSARDTLGQPPMAARPTAAAPTPTLTWSSKASAPALASAAASTDIGPPPPAPVQRQPDPPAPVLPRQTPLPAQREASAPPPAPRAQTEPRPTLSPAVLRGSQPDLFGTVALVVGSTPQDAQWRRVSNAPLPSEAGPWAGLLRRARNLSAAEQLSVVNAWVNAAITFTPDSEQYGVADYWATAEESLRSGRGDCEDYAIAKMQLLRALGVSPQDLYLVIAHDLIRRADHAVLAVRENGRFWILDSGATVMAAEDVQDYRPVMTFSAGRTWVHGYRRQPALILASASPSGRLGGGEH